MRSAQNKSGWVKKRTATEAVWGLKKPEKEIEKGLWFGSWGEKVVTRNEGGWGVKELVNDSEKGAGSGSSWGQKFMNFTLYQILLKVVGHSDYIHTDNPTRSHKASRRHRGPTDHNALRRQRGPTDDPIRSKCYPMPASKHPYVAKGHLNQRKTSNHQGAS
ncbi:hypothetical protein Tco_0231757 [Tanacetum coccineum]